jgi:hypothetical protein
MSFAPKPRIRILQIPTLEQTEERLLIGAAQRQPFVGTMRGHRAENDIPLIVQIVEETHRPVHLPRIPENEALAPSIVPGYASDNRDRLDDIFEVLALR